MQEQIEREAIAISVNATKITAQTLARILTAIAHQIKKEHQKAKTHHGKQTIKELMDHNCPTSTIPIEGDKGLFEHIARKWHVDYAFHRTGPKKYLLLFKTGQADAITSAFSEYSKRIMQRAKDKRQPIMQQLEKAAEQAKQQNRTQKEHHLKREATRE